MKRHLLLVIAGVLTVAACGGAENTGDSAVPATDANPTEVTLLDRKSTRLNSSHRT